MKCRVLTVVLLSCAVPAAAAVLSSGILSHPGAGRSGDPGPFASDLEAESRELDRQLQSTAAHHELLERLSTDLIARRRTLPEAATVLADVSRQSKPDWLRRAGRLYPGRSEQAAVAASLVNYSLFRLQDGDPSDEDTARRLTAAYRACYGVPLTLPEPAKGAARPPYWQNVAPASPLLPAEQRR
jgi:hypothetical protein